MEKNLPKMKIIRKCRIHILYALAGNVIIFVFLCGSYFYYDKFIFGSSTTNMKFFSNVRNSSAPVAGQTFQSTSVPVPVAIEKEKKNIFFLKTHKTGSSTVQNILMRFGHRNSLNFMLPEKHNYLGYTTPVRMEDVHSDSVPSDNKFNIFAHHTRYRRETNRFLYADAVRVTLLRDPPELFESIFSYYKLRGLYRVSDLRQLVDSLPRIERVKISAKRKIYGCNQMSRDLGLDEIYSANRTEIGNFIRFIDAEFDLIMIKEHMEASLVLLADMMGWPLRYVSFVPLNVRSNGSRSTLTENDRFKLSQFNHADRLLYDHFLDKFRNNVLGYGFERMVADVQKLLAINAELKERCVLSENNEGYARTINYRLKNNSDWNCIYSTKKELIFTKELRDEQIARLTLIKRLKNFVIHGHRV